MVAGCISGPSDHLITQDCGEKKAGGDLWTDQFLCVILLFLLFLYSLSVFLANVMDI